MITVFNRKELFTTFDMEKQALVRSRLKADNIEYRIRVVSKGSSSRGRMYNPGGHRNLDTQYIFYVKKKDYDEAYSMIRMCQF